MGFLDNNLGNPLLLRRALDMGVKIIVAHVASEGECDDLDNPISNSIIFLYKNIDKFCKFFLKKKIINQSLRKLQQSSCYLD